MYFETNCPHCSKRLKVAEEHQGKTALCPFCNQRIVLDHSPQPEVVEQGAFKSQLWSDETPAASEDEFETAEENDSVVELDTEIREGNSEVRDQQPVVQHKYVGKPNGTSVSLVAATAMGFVLMGIWYMAVVLPMHSTYLGELFLERGWVTYAIAYLACWTAATLMLKTRKLRRQQKSLLLDVLPAGISETIGPENVDRFHEHLKQLPGEPKHSFLISRVKRALEYFRARRNAEEVALMLNSQAELDAVSVESSYTMVKVFIWAIPILGFIGTVLGISGAVSGFSESIQTAQELDVIKSSLGAVTSHLAYAFDTTLVALVVSVLLMVPASSMQKREEDILSSVDGYCGEHLLQRLQRDQGDQGEGQPLKDVVSEALQQHEERLNQWSEQLRTIGETVTGSVVAGWQTIHTQLQQSQQAQAQQLREAGDAIAGERASYLEQLQTAQDEQIEKMSELVGAMTAERTDYVAQLQTAQGAQLQKLTIVVDAIAGERASYLEQLQAVQDTQAEKLMETGAAVAAERTSYLTQLQAVQETQADRLTNVVESMVTSADRIQQQISDAQEKQVQTHQDVVGELAGSLRELQQQAFQHHRDEAEVLESLTSQLGENLQGLQQQVGSVQVEFAQTMQSLTPTVQDGLSRVAAGIEDALQQKFESLGQVADSMERQSDTLGTHLKDFRVVYTQSTADVVGALRDLLQQMPDQIVASQQILLDRLSDAVGSMSECTTSIQQEASVARSEIRDSSKVALELHQANDTAHEAIGELVSRIDNVVAHQQQSTTTQRELASSLRRMATTDAFGEMLSTVTEAQRGLLGAASYVQEQAEQLTAENVKPNGRRPFFGRRAV